MTTHDYMLSHGVEDEELEEALSKPTDADTKGDDDGA